METKLLMEKEFSEVSLTSLEGIAAEVYQFGKDYTIWLFEAKMGAGKTTFIKSLCKHLQVADTVSSPTFSIVNEYESKKLGIIYHFDFYRIENEMEALEIGVEDYFYSKKLCLIEWPQLIPSFIPASYLSVKISVNSVSGNRGIMVRKYGKGSIS